MARNTIECRHAVLSHVGLVRSRNEDAFGMQPEQGVFVLADGMGGHPSGDLAAKIAVESTIDYLTAPRKPGRSRARPQRMAEAALVSDQAVIETSRQFDDRQGMGTTLVGVWLGRSFIDVIHVGDSRAYCFNGTRLEQITTDHTLVQELISSGQLRQDSPEVKRFGHILSQAVGLGGDDLRPTHSRFRRRKGDLILLASDGLTDLVANQEIADILVTYSDDLEKTAQVLVDAALREGGKDNITVLLTSCL